MSAAEPEMPLPRGDVSEGVVRVGATVRRPRGPQSDAVAAYLAHLDAAGFEGAPRWLGVDARGRDVLDFLEGEVPAAEPEPWAAEDAALAALAGLLRRLHGASMGWVPPTNAVWFGAAVDALLPTGLAPLFEVAELVTHCDVTPQNVVFRGGTPWGLIDFDLTRPTTRLLDVFNTAMHWVPLKHPDDRSAAHRGTDTGARLRLFVDAYGLGLGDRAAMLDLGQRATLRSWHRMRANATVHGGGWARMWDEGVGDCILRRGAWLADSAPTLTAAMLRP